LYISIINQLIKNGAEGIVLGCTEIPLMISQENVSVPVFDTTKIHSKTAVGFVFQYKLAIRKRWQTMKICVAQTRPIKGDIPGNTADHLKLINLAVANDVEIIVFPELSITGYEPDLAKELATYPGDNRFDIFQKISDDSQLTIGIGVPIKTNSGITISMVIFQPYKPRELYSKKYLHSDEEQFFVSGQSSICLIGPKTNIALAICYELSVPEHSEKAFKSGAEIYLTSVAKTASGVEKAAESLSSIAKNIQ
jgi:predicted amidohydrolase